MMRTHTRALCLALALAYTLPSVALARTVRDVDYAQAQVWNAAVRLVRVDYRFTVDERDDEHGFVLFQHRAYGRDHAASIEVIRIRAPAGERIRIVVQVAGMPAQAEERIMIDLVAKLRADYGVATPPSVAPVGDSDAPTPGLVPRLSPAPSRIPDDGDPPTNPTPSPDSGSTAPHSNRERANPDGVRPAGSAPPTRSTSEMSPR